MFSKKLKQTGKSADERWMNIKKIHPAIFCSTFWKLKLIKNSESKKVEKKYQGAKIILMPNLSETVAGWQWEWYLLESIEE